MATILPPKSESICIETLLHVPEILGQANKRWHSAFVTIYCSRTILSFFTESLSGKKNTEISCCPSSTIEDLRQSNSVQIDRTSLTELVKEKNVDSLHSLPEKKDVDISRSPSFIIMNLKPPAELVQEISIHKFHSLHENKNPGLSHCPSFTIVDLDHNKRFKIDQYCLIQLVKEKNVDRLQKFGGVDAVASSLHTNAELGIEGDVEDIALVEGPDLEFQKLEFF